VQQAFGPEYFLPDGAVNRSKLRRLVFTDPAERDKLNAIVHPEVMKEINRRLEEFEACVQETVVLVDVPLLLEVGMVHRFDKVIVVYAHESAQIERLMQRDGITKEEASEALHAQMPLSKKVEAADFVIDNSGILEETRGQVKKMWQELLALASGRGRSGE
jgi:dephospho-CoA kinase